MDVLASVVLVVVQKLPAFKFNLISSEIPLRKEDVLVRDDAVILEVSLVEDLYKYVHIILSELGAIQVVDLCDGDDFRQVYPIELCACVSFVWISGCVL